MSHGSLRGWSCRGRTFAERPPFKLLDGPPEKMGEGSGVVVAPDTDRRSVPLLENVVVIECALGGRLVMFLLLYPTP